MKVVKAVLLGFVEAVNLLARHFPIRLMFWLLIELMGFHGFSVARYTSYFEKRPKSQPKSGFYFGNQLFLTYGCWKKIRLVNFTYELRISLRNIRCSS